MPRKQKNEQFLKGQNKKKKEQKKEKFKNYGKYTQKHIRITIDNLCRQKKTNNKKTTD